MPRTSSMPKTPRRLSRSEEILDDAFGLLGGELVLAHAKDVKRSGEVVAAGKGDLDYDLYLRHLSEAGYAGPLVLHGLAEEEVAGSLAFLREKTGRGRFGRRTSWMWARPSTG